MPMSSAEVSDARPCYVVGGFVLHGFVDLLSRSWVGVGVVLAPALLALCSHAASRENGVFGQERAGLGVFVGLLGELSRGGVVSGSGWVEMDWVRVGW